MPNTVSKKDKAYQVTSLSDHDILEIFHLRSVLEAEGVGLAAGRITEDDIYLLEGLKRRDKLGSQEAMKRHIEDTKNRSLSRF